MEEDRRMESINVILKVSGKLIAVCTVLEVARVAA